MKIAIISDIHGNKIALDNVLENIKLNSADKIFVLGDLAMGGYDPNYTIEKLFQLKDSMGEDFEIIQGNTDKLIVKFTKEFYDNFYEKNPLMFSALALDDTEIKPENKNLLANLEEQKMVEINGVKILLTHGSPRKQDENLFPDTPVETIEQAVANTDADVILCGHTHIPCGFSLNSNKTVVNVGSVGRSMTDDKMPIYLMMTVNKNGEFSFEHKKVYYDNKAVAQIIEKRNFKHSVEFSKLYL